MNRYVAALQAAGAISLIVIILAISTAVLAMFLGAVLGDER